jgi:hypothetical protein
MDMTTLAYCIIVIVAVGGLVLVFTDSSDYDEWDKNKDL